MDETTEADSDNAEPASGTTDQVQMPLPATGGPATGETWRLVAIYTPADSSNVEVPDELQAKHTIRFEQGRAFLQLNCNRGFASATSEWPGPGEIKPLTIGPIGSSRRLCPPPNEFSDSLAQNLMSAEKVGLSLGGDELVIITKGPHFRFLKLEE